MLYRSYAAALLAVLLPLTACTFDGTALTQRACTSSDECASGACVGGYCQGSDDDALDGGTDADALDAADATDAGIDAAGDVADAADVAVDAVDDVSPDPDGATCEEGNTVCDGSSVLVCDEGEWTISTDCAGEGCASETGCRCELGACVPRACVPGARRCAGSAVTECDDAGRGFVVVDTCGAGTACDAGNCVEVACEPDAQTCVGETRVVCDGDGQVEAQEDCAADAAWCDDSAGGAVCVPRECEPLATACARDVDQPGTGVVTCDGRGAAWGGAVACDTGELCRDGVCVESTCVEGETTCLDDLTLGVCDDAGAAFAPSPCAAETFCDGDACVPRVCEPGATRCAAAPGAVERCDEIGSSWEAFGSCDADSSCVDGACVDRVCVPGAAFCTPDGDAATCNADGTDVSGVEPCTWRCAAGACQPSVCGDGIVDASSGEACDDGNELACDGCEGCALRSHLRVGPGSSTSGGPGWEPGEATFTLEAWIDATASGAIAGLGESNAEDWVRLELSDGRPAFRFSLGGGDVVSAIGPRSVVGDGWTHIAGVRTGTGAAAIYVDGILVGLDRPDVSRSSVDAGAGRIWVASDGRLPSLTGAIDEVRLSNGTRYTANFAPPRRVLVDDAARFVVALDDGAGSSAVETIGGTTLALAGATWGSDTCLASSAGAIRCGDGVRATWESCDDGGVTGGDGCSGACTLESPCASGTVRPGTTSCYVRVERARSWDDTRRACTGWGGDLVTIGSSGENEWVAGTLGGDAWIGLTDSGFFNENTFRWASEAGDDYRNWAPGEPNDGGSVFDEEDCIELRGDGLWNDIDCAAARGAICER